MVHNWPSKGPLLKVEREVGFLVLRLIGLLQVFVQGLLQVGLRPGVGSSCWMVRWVLGRPGVASASGVDLSQKAEKRY